MTDSLAKPANLPDTYRGWSFSYDPPPIPSRACDWHWVHDDFDGAPDGNDNRCGSESSFAAALCACDDWEDEND